MRNAYSRRQNMLVFAWYGKHYFVIVFIAVYIMCVWKLYLKKNVVVSYGCLFMVS